MSAKLHPKTRGSAAVSPLDLTIAAQVGKAHVTMLRRQLRRAHALLKPPLNELSIALVGDRRMAELHMQFMSIPGPTDVLTFPLELDAKGHATSGEVVICVPYARRAARENSATLPQELLLYAIHGMLHLSGYDDLTAKQFKIMHQKEDELLTRLGVGPVFRLPQASAAGRHNHK
jgi:probable rRNA maturation factor